VAAGDAGSNDLHDAAALSWGTLFGVAVSASNKRKTHPIVVQGVEFPSIAAAARHYGKPEKLFRKRMLVSGLTPEQALELEPFPDWFVPGKGQFARARGNARRATEETLGLRRCGTCGQSKQLSEFHKRRGDLLSFRCRQCTAAALIKSRYGLAQKDFADMVDRQQGCCAICLTDLRLRAGSVCRDKTVAVDHCHKTGQVRGLLCSMCNTGLGNFADSPARLTAAINYLHRSSSEWPAPD